MARPRIRVQNPSAPVFVFRRVGTAGSVKVREFPNFEEFKRWYSTTDLTVVGTMARDEFTDILALMADPGPPYPADLTDDEKRMRAYDEWDLHARRR